MAALNIRDVDVTSLELFKDRAKAEGLTLRAWVLAVLQVALMDGEGSAAAQVEARRPAAPRVRQRAQAEPTAPEPQEASAAAAPILPSLTGERLAHDPKTCRVYRCGACAKVGHHDPHRGL